MYYLIPRLFGRAEMYSIKLITLHFWVATIGVVLYIAAMWIAGVTQGLMWRAVNPDGTLTYSFVEAVKAMYPFYGIRLLGGALFFSGMLIMAYNVVKTVAGHKAVDAPIPARCRRTRLIEGATKWLLSVSRQDRTQHRPHDRADHPHGRRGRVGRDRAPLFPEIPDRTGGGFEAVHRAAARGSRRLHPRRLLYLPLPDDPSLPRRDRALRPLLGRGRVGLRSPVPVGQQAHRARPRARRRALLGRVAPGPFQPTPRRGARVQHARLSLAAADGARRHRKCRSS